MNVETWGEVALLAICVMVAGLASAAETALTSVGRIRLRHLAEEGSRTARMVDQMLEHPSNLLSTILVVNNLSVIIASSVTTILTIKLIHFPNAEAAVTIAL